MGGKTASRKWVGVAKRRLKYGLHKLAFELITALLQTVLFDLDTKRQSQVSLLCMCLCVRDRDYYKINMNS